MYDPKIFESESDYQNTFTYAKNIFNSILWSFTFPPCRFLTNPATSKT